ncbi:MAG: permease [Bacteroidales bacterium]|nr:permease [Bacteroidales bacterium]
MLIILLAAIPVYICATASVPIAAVLMLKGLSPGAALVLLMAGPATNAATITMIAKVMGRKSLVSYLASIISGALIFGLPDK